MPAKPSFPPKLYNAFPIAVFLTENSLGTERAIFILDPVFQAAHQLVFGSLARRSLQRKLEQGLPEGFRAAVELVVSASLDPAARQVAARVEALRETVARRPEPFTVEFGPAKNRARSAATIAYHSSVNRTWGLVLHLCAREFKTAAILELGSCAGISGSYLAVAPACRRLVTIEASRALASLAERTLSQVSQRAEVHHGFVEDVLPRVLPTFQNGIDLAFIDARHEREATLGYWREVRPRLNEGALIVFDDIRWSRGMWEAWNTVRRQTGVSCTLDLGRFGICVCDSSATVAESYNFAFYAGWLRVLRKDQSTR